MPTAPQLHILDTAVIDERDSAFPQAAELPGGELVCAYSVGGGPNAHGQTEWSRSTDGGKTWRRAGVILPKTRDDVSNFMKLSATRDGSAIHAYGARLYRKKGEKFGSHPSEAITCTSRDRGETWSDPRVVPFDTADGVEVSHGILVRPDGRLLAPAAILPKDRLGEQVRVAISDDGGETWPRYAVALQDPNGKHGYFEQKLANLPDGRIMAAAWTVTLGDVADRENHFAISSDNGDTWSAPRPTGIQGQTLAPIPLGGDRLLALYNRRYGQQGIVAAFVTFTDDAWTVHGETLVYDANANRQRPEDGDGGVDEFDAFEFGFPTGMVLSDGDILMTCWRRESSDKQFGVAAMRLRVEWPG